VKTTCEDHYRAASARVTVLHERCKSDARSRDCDSAGALQKHDDAAVRHASVGRVVALLAIERIVHNERLRYS
jgi:hypothetical protein